LCSLVAALMARFSLRSDSQLMWVRVVTGSDIVGLGPAIARKLLLETDEVTQYAQNVRTIEHKLTFFRFPYQNTSQAFLPLLT
jgi:hypothetical protein